MSRIIVKFKKRADYDTRTEQAVSFICDLFGFTSPWFNDDAWFDDNRRTLIIGSGHNDTDVAGKINVLKILYKEEIEEIYEELDDDEQSDLKPCPCCGSTKIHVVAPDDGCYCWECGLAMPKRPNWRERWNRRVEE